MLRVYASTKFSPFHLHVIQDFLILVVLTKPVAHGLLSRGPNLTFRHPLGILWSVEQVSKKNAVHGYWCDLILILLLSTLQSVERSEVIRLNCCYLTQI